MNIQIMRDNYMYHNYRKERAFFARSLHSFFNMFQVIHFLFLHNMNFLRDLAKMSEHCVLIRTETSFRRYNRVLIYNLYLLHSEIDY